MKVSKMDIEGVLVIEPDVHGDSRGWFMEQYNSERYKAVGVMADFVQDNVSLSFKGVVRGLHWQAGKHCQAKLMWVIKGAVWDVVVDIRRGSPTFGKHHSVVLTGENKKQFFVPRGFAHGFVVLEDDTLFSYKCDNLYCKESERGLMFNDPALGIDWPDIGKEIKLSDRDQKHPPLSGIEPYEA